MSLSVWNSQHMTTVGVAAIGSFPVPNPRSFVRGIPLADLCAKVLAKANQFYAAEGALAGICGKHGDAVAAMTDVRDVIVYDWMSGWPG